MAKRGQGEGSISKRPDGTWWARITVGKDENGKQKRRAFYGKTRKEVQEKLTAAVNDVNNDVYIEPSNMTVAQWSEIWLKQYKKNTVKPKTYMNLESYFRLYINPELGKIKLCDLRNEMLQTLVNKMSDGGLSYSVVTHMKVAFQSSIFKACENNIVSKKVAESLLNVETPKLNYYQTMPALSEEQQAELIKISKDYKHGNIIVFMLGTGLRIGDAYVKHKLKIFSNSRVFICGISKRKSTTCSHTRAAALFDYRMLFGGTG